MSNEKIRRRFSEEDEEYESTPEPKKNICEDSYEDTINFFTKFAESFKDSLSGEDG